MPPGAPAPTAAPDAPDAAAQRVHERRWWILGVLCLSLLIVFSMIIGLIAVAITPAGF